MTRELIMKDYFTKRMRGERVNLESMINSLTKTQLIQLAKNDTIFIKSDWNKQQIAERVMGSIEHSIAYITCSILPITLSAICCLFQSDLINIVSFLAN